MKTILFQGDSVTDCQRDYAVDRLLGQGYPLLVSGRLGFEQPGSYHMLNRGVSGNRVVDLYARCKRDCWNLQPDYLSILIGINDVWHEFDSGNGVDAVRFENIYRLLLTETKERLPDCKIILMEPFCLPGTGINDYGYAAFRAEVALRQAVAAKLAAELDLALLPLQQCFDEAAETTTPAYWLFDGVHPTPAGHGLIADRWLKTFGKLVESEAAVRVRQG